MVTNAYKIQFESDLLHLIRIPYDSNKLNDLRSKHNKTHSFFRSGDTIFASPDSDSPLELGEKVGLSVSENPELVSNLTKHVFFRTFRKNYPDIIPLSFYPFRILSRQEKHDVISSFLPSQLKNKIGFKRQTEIQFRRIEINNVLSHVVTINIFYKWILTENCLDLLSDGFDLKGLEVAQLISGPGMDGIIAPDESVVGSVISVDNEMAEVETNHGRESIHLSMLHLHKSKVNIEAYLRSKVAEEQYSNITNAIREHDTDRFNPKWIFDETKSMAGLLSRLEFKNSLDFSFKILNNSDLNLKRLSVVTPQSIFDYNSIKTHQYPDIGLNSYGPFDSITFDTKHPRVLVICHKSNRGAFSGFLAKMKDGLPQSQYFKKGFVSKYGLSGIDFAIEEIDDYSIDSYRSKVDALIRNTEQNFNLAILETKLEFKRYSIESNPYYSLKAYLLSFQIPVQFITSDKARNPTDALLNTICLQIYAKLGGIPWVLPTNQTIDREIVIGIGSSIIRRNRFAGTDQARIVGISTFFGADGKYLFADRCRDVEYDHYFNELLASLSSSINFLSKRDGWSNGDTVRIVFHIFKPIRNIEIDVVQNLISQFVQYSISFAFVTFSEMQPFILFDPSQRGVTVGKSTKGAYVPQRGENCVINRNECVLQMIGPREIRTTKHGSSRPVLIRIHPKSTFHDLHYIVQQAYSFTGLSWRSFLPRQTPATLLYAELIAKQLANLRMISGWNPEIVSSQLKFKKWFL